MADSFPLFGLHDRAGGEFLAQHDFRGWCVDEVAVGLQARKLDYTALAAKNVRVIVQLEFGDNQGTLPPPEQYAPFASAVIGTIRNSTGVFAWVIGNEPNKRDNWPPGQEITPEQYAQAWNLIWFSVPKGVPAIPAPLDPYWGLGSDPRDYWSRMLKAILAGSGGKRGGADGLMFHPKVRWHDKSLVRSDVTFTDPPLKGVPYHWKAWQALYDATPAFFRNLPIYLTQCRADLKVENGDLGWLDDDGGLIEEMYAYEREQNVKHNNLVWALALYRWNAGPWSLNKPGYMEVLKAAASDPAMEHQEIAVAPVAPFTWPSESRVVTQSFGVNKAYYSQFALPGHEGVDIGAPTGSKILAAYDGMITLVDPNHHAYGYSIRHQIQLDGHMYVLVYAHGTAGSALVKPGQPVKAGDVLMLADSTGNSQGPHLHFSMVEPGATFMDQDETGQARTWPFNILDPSPFLGI